jgi:hypothetical protein
MHSSHVLLKKEMAQEHNWFAASFLTSVCRMSMRMKVIFDTPVGFNPKTTTGLRG